MQILVNRTLTEEMDENDDYYHFNDFFKKNVSKIENLCKILTNKIFFEEAQRKSEILVKVESEQSFFLTKKISADLETQNSTSISKDEFKQVLTSRKISKKKDKKVSVEKDFARKSTVSFLEKLKSKRKSRSGTLIVQSLLKDVKKFSFPFYIFDNFEALRELLVSLFNSSSHSDEYKEIQHTLFRIERISSCQTFVKNYFDENIKKDN